MKQTTLFLPILLSGCATLTPAGLEGSASLSLTPRIEAGRSVQALVTPYTKASVVHLLVKLYRLEGEQEMPIPVEADLQPVQYDSPIRFASLHHQTTYRVRAFAYKASGTDASDLISLGASSSVDVRVDADDRPTVAVLPIQLVDKIFDGQATGSLSFASGSLVPAGTESISF